jgi:sortase A
MASARPRGASAERGPGPGAAAVAPRARAGGEPEARRANRTLSESLVELGFTSRTDVETATSLAGTRGRTPERVLAEEGFVSGRQIVEAARHRWGLEAAAPARALPRAARTTRSRPRRVGVARLFRVLSTAAATAAAVVAAEIAVTLVWKEPATALVAQLDQAALDGELDALERRQGRESSFAAHAAAIEQLATRASRRAVAGEAIGRIELPALGGSYVMVEGVDDGPLRKGPGHFPDSAFPGEGDTVAIAGHRTTYLAPFRRLDELDRGDPIVAAMPYARVEYRVEKTTIVEPDDYWVTSPVGYERLVLTACHPRFSLAQRIVVFARQTAVKPA